MAITVTPLSDALGAEIGGVDLAAELDPATAAAIKAALAEHIVLVFRDQDFGPEDQLRFARYLGPVADRPKPAGYVIPESSNRNPGIAFVSNIRDEDGEPIGIIPDGEMWFHHDTSYKETPDRATMLFAIDIPSHGGDTLFANMYRAYDSLPAEIKRTLEGKQALNVYDYALTERVDMSATALAEVEHARHPAVITHPVTGLRALYVSRLMTVRLEGMARDESEVVLATVFDHAERADIVYRHRWRPGDFIVWDNLASTHARTDFPDTERRLLRRCKVAGEGINL